MVACEHTHGQKIKKGVNADSLLANYIKYTHNKLIRQNRKNNITEEWFEDGIELKNGINYQVYQIGHDVTDKGGANKRFIADEWVYLDTVKNKVYVYDIFTDVLIEWKK